MFHGGSFSPMQMQLLEDLVVCVAAGMSVVVAVMAMVGATVVVVVVETAMAPPSKEDNPRSPTRSARKPTMKPLIVGDAMKMKTTINPRLQELLPLVM
jgi:hypothetical protein